MRKYLLLIISLITISLLSCANPAMKTTKDLKHNTNSDETPTPNNPTKPTPEPNFIEFGRWPQTKYNGDEKKLTKCENINNWDNCYKGEDGSYYVKVTATPFDDNYVFSDGTKIVEGKDYFFKFEPIKWRIITNNYNGSNKKLFLSDKALAVKSFNAQDFNEYNTSEIRDYLNGYKNALGFLQLAFTEEEIKKIETTIVDNSASSALPVDDEAEKPAGVPDTEDKIFLLSEKEVTTIEYGFGNDTIEDTKRQVKPTDYAMATGIYVSDKGNVRWWLRSPNYISYFNGSARCVYEDGSANSHFRVSNTNIGVVPSLSFSFDNKR